MDGSKKKVKLPRLDQHYSSQKSGSVRLVSATRSCTEVEDKCRTSCCVHEEVRSSKYQISDTLSCLVPFLPTCCDRKHMLLLVQATSASGGIFQENVFIICVWLT